ncbi:type II toxin-antitoxin system prevent-host-death family antitoxin [Rhodococcus opacus]|nr:type II toxin-antitoxin system prevent-host-death family antitoxin [Rhodococcus opacus]RZL79322.1 MAG: type II toxin-antitoxin system prevent-host-death family antitoxin [Rhodococcus sp. (in: high G+C Gram-positive bacteria)]
MTAITATEARKNLFGLISQVNEDHTSVEIVSKDSNAVLMSKDDYESMVETAYLLSSPVNARWLLGSLEQARSGSTTKRELIDDEGDLHR